MPNINEYVKTEPQEEEEQSVEINQFTGQEIMDTPSSMDQTPEILLKK
jgi:hypothetical protein